MVSEGHSCAEGSGFEYQHGILDGHFFTHFCCKNCNVCLKRRKRGRDDPFLKKITPWCSFAEGDEGLHMPNQQSN